MKFDVIRRLQSVENSLDGYIDRASRSLASPGERPDRLARAIRAGRPIARHPMWPTFARFAGPVLEAKNHITAEREAYEAEAEDQITQAVRKLRRQK